MELTTDFLLESVIIVSGAMYYFACKPSWGGQGVTGHTRLWEIIKLLEWDLTSGHVSVTRA